MNCLQGGPKPSYWDRLGWDRIATRVALAVQGSGVERAIGIKSACFQSESCEDGQALPKHRRPWHQLVWLKPQSLSECLAFGFAWLCLPGCWRVRADAAGSVTTIGNSRNLSTNLAQRTET